MKETSVCDVALVLLLGAVFATSAVAADWWKHWTSLAPSAIQQELVLPQNAS